MLRIIALSYLLVHVVSGLTEGDVQLQDVFDQVVSNVTDTFCTNIVGTGKGCYECYICNDTAVDRQRANGKIKTEFQLFDNKCSKTDICCFSQSQNTFRSGGANCGASNPEGYPRRVRDSLRSVLPGEYPWRAWVYDKANQTAAVCGAVFISEESRALITSAYCVEPYIPENLVIRFTRDHNSHFYEYEVRTVIMHHYFNSDSRYNDIAIIGLKFEYSLPVWVKPVCWSEYKIPFASACIAISNDDNYVNTIIPQQTKCVDGKIPLDESFICTVAPRNDYEPEFGGGLICPEEVPHAMNTMYYTAYGITLYKSGSTSIMVHTNVTYFHNWIQDRIEELSAQYDTSR